MNESDYQVWLEGLIRQQIREALIKEGRVMYARETDNTSEAEALKLEIETLLRKVAGNQDMQQAIAHVFERMIQTILADAEAQRQGLHSS
jgi:hypothetical protein